MGWLRHYLGKFKAKEPASDEDVCVDCHYRLRYDDGLILCYYFGVRSVESCKSCEFKVR